MVGHVTHFLPFQVEIGVVREIDDGLGIGVRRQTERQLMVFRPGVAGFHVQRAGIPGVSYRADKREFHAVGYLFRIPDPIGETLIERTAVQVVRTVVDGQLIRLAAQGETARRNAVRIAAGHLAHARPVGIIIFGIAIAQHHVGHLPVAVRDDDRYDAGAQVGEDHLRAISIDEAEQLDVIGIDHGCQISRAPSEISTSITRGSLSNFT